MTKLVLRAAAIVGCTCFATMSFAQGSGVNPMGLDLGGLHTILPSPIPTQVTTYYPPPTVASHRRHRRVR